jgi:Transposase DDE domain group 1
MGGRLNPDFHFGRSSVNHQIASDAFIYAGLNASKGRGGQHQVGDKENKPFQLSFNGFLKVDFQGSRVTSDGGLLLVRELDERLGFGKLLDAHLSDPRQGANKKFLFADLVRQSVYSRLAGYEDLNDAARVAADPTFRLIGSKKNWDRGGALTSRL